MYRNKTLQKIGAQVLTASTGLAFTGTVSCYVTKDAGTQTAGGGTVTPEGRGYFTYEPTQGETDADLVAFTFDGAGAVPTTIQVETVDKFISDMLAAAARTMMKAKVSSGASGTSFVITQIETANGVNQTVGANALSGRRIYFDGATPSAALQGVGGRITANNNSASPTLTIDSNDAFPTTPAVNDVCIIL